MSAHPIGVFDSGVGGLSVLREIRASMPGEDIIYFGDQGHVPYGPRPMKQIQDFSEGITRFLLGEGAKIIVVACNTASAAALKHLRETFPDVQFVGMEPAVKPAAEKTQTGRVGVLATPATFQGALYASVVERFANGVELFQNTCNGLVQEIERGNLNGEATRRILEDALRPMLEKDIDTVVLGCTHYPFVIPLIERIVGEKVRVIDPAPAVARQVKRLLEAGGMLNQNGSGSVRFVTSGEAESVQSVLRVLLGIESAVEAVTWKDDREIQSPPRPSSAYP
ncbi:MAG: glutamate racemase [Chloroflexi bacterium]|nr:glutamate racemase [Chloroflexota bacterium]MDL1942452.1 glutamate racemase [Chloroflexi bacterium CFX2]